MNVKRALLLILAAVLALSCFSFAGAEEGTGENGLLELWDWGGESMTHVASAIPVGEGAAIVSSAVLPQNTDTLALSDGVNAGEEQAKELAERLRGMQCHVNLIPLNVVEERDMRGVTEENVRKFLKILQERNISATRRREMGDDIEGACGQLRRKTINGSKGE